jgi:hypothetical protein
LDVLIEAGAGATTDGFKIDEASVAGLVRPEEDHRRIHVRRGGEDLLLRQNVGECLEDRANHALATRRTDSNGGRKLRSNERALFRDDGDRQSHAFVRRKRWVEERLDRVVAGGIKGSLGNVDRASRLRVGAGEIEGDLFAFHPNSNLDTAGVETDAVTVDKGFALVDAVRHLLDALA